MKKKRYVLYKTNERIGEYDHITEVVESIGCSRQHFYQAIEGSNLRFGGDDYKIIDRLSEHYFEMMMGRMDDLFNI